MQDPSTPTNEDLTRAHRIARPAAKFMRRWRAMIARRPWLEVVYKTLLTVLGVGIVVVGLILVPLPGPGWLIVFIGLTVLGSEFHWARRITTWLRLQLSRFWTWWRARKEAKTAQATTATTAQAAPAKQSEATPAKPSQATPLHTTGLTQKCGRPLEGSTAFESFEII